MTANCDDGSHTFHVSTGGGYTFVNPRTNRQGVAITPTGSFHVCRKLVSDPDPWGTLDHPLYFDCGQGIAIHGYPEVPDQPVSHGCVRVEHSAIMWLYPRVQIGTRVDVNP